MCVGFRIKASIGEGLHLTVDYNCRCQLSVATINDDYLGFWLSHEFSSGINYGKHPDLFRSGIASSTLIHHSGWGFAPVRAQGDSATFAHKRNVDEVTSLYHFTGINLTGFSFGMVFFYDVAIFLSHPDLCSSNLYRAVSMLLLSPVGTSMMKQACEE